MGRPPHTSHDAYCKVVITLMTVVMSVIAC
jgi:hypothetical protein